MPTYRVYCLTANGTVSNADWIEADNDAHAIEHVRETKKTAKFCELWDHQRLVARIDMKSGRSTLA